MPVSTLTLVSCVGRKAERPALARDLYISPWFAKARRFAESRGAPWFILSAEHGLLSPVRVIAPYERALNAMKAPERRAWAERVASELRRQGQRWDSIVVLAGRRYREYLLEHLEQLAMRVEMPLEGLGIGEQLRWFNQRLGA